MEPEPSLIMIQFLQWVADRPRRRADVLDAWQSSCPRFPVWEDARAEGLVRQTGGGENRVELTEHGRRALARAGALEVSPPDQRSDQLSASGSGP
jgi:hypothetical protein